MKNIVYILFILLLVTSCAPDSSEQNESNVESVMTQAEFAQEILDNTDAIKAEWKDDLRLNVYYDNEFLIKDEDNDNYLIKAKLIADSLATDGFKYTGKDICVYVYNSPSSDPINSTCVKKEDS